MAHMQAGPMHQLFLLKKGRQDENRMSLFAIRSLDCTRLTMPISVGRETQIAISQDFQVEPADPSNGTRFERRANLGVH
jgi:hypothetical protein